MYENWAGIRLKGASFKEKTELTFFPKGESICVVYGKNGTGKSTISRAILKLSQSIESDRDDITVSAVAADGKDIALSDDERRGIFVFNEDYVQKNVGLQDSGLNTIVMFGEQNELTVKIKEVENELKVVNDKIQDAEEDQKSFLDKKNECSPDYYKNLITESGLKGAGHWVERDLAIQRGVSPTAGNKRYVTDFLVKNIMKCTPKLSYGELFKQYDIKLKKLEKIAVVDKPINESAALNLSRINDEKIVCEILRKKLDSPILSEREQKILDLSADRLEEMKKTFSSVNIHACPFCCQEVTDEYKIKLINEIKRVLNKDVENHQIELGKLKMEKFSFDFIPYKALSREVIDECEEQIRLLNQAIDQINDQLDKKINNPYIPIQFEPVRLKERKDNCEKAFNKLENERELFNRELNQIEELKADLDDINMKLAWYEIKDDYEKWNKSCTVRSEKETKLNELRKSYNDIKARLARLNGQRANIHIAIEEINRSLQYVFYNRRMELISKDDKYHLIIDSESVTPNRVSTGERNIIGLCYFFSEIKKNSDVRKAYAEPRFLVIDDPISSFDADNRVGMLSLIKLYMQKIFKGNDENKIILMTHDLSTFWDIGNVICLDVCKILEKKRKIQVQCVRLVDKKMVLFNKKEGYYGYNDLIKTVYDYTAGATSSNLNLEMSIGNIMRRLMEAFLTFEFRCGVVSIGRDGDVLKFLENTNQREYFRNRMNRLMLDAESHEKDRVKFLDDPSLISVTDRETKILIAKDILCLMYCLNPIHIRAQLGEKATTVIQKWSEDIFSADVG